MRLKEHSYCPFTHYIRPSMAVNTRCSKQGPPRHDIQQLSHQELISLIIAEQQKDLEARREAAIRRHGRRPTVLNENFTNSIIIACHAQLAALETASATAVAQAESPPAGNSVATSEPGSPLGTIIASPQHRTCPQPIEQCKDSANSTVPDISGAAKIEDTPTGPTSNVPVGDTTLMELKHLESDDDMPGHMEPDVLFDSAPFFEPSMSEKEEECHDPMYHLQSAHCLQSPPATSQSPAASPVTTQVSAAAHSSAAVETAVTTNHTIDGVTPIDAAAATGDQVVHTKAPRQRCPGKPRPGALTTEQLGILRDKNAELECWVMKQATKWNVSTLTIITNMGLDNCEKRALNIWNIFQAVFWHHAIEQYDKEHGEVVKPNTFDGEATARRCHEEYALLSADCDDITEEKLEAIKKKKTEIMAEYEAIQEDEVLQFWEGNTVRFMCEARKELSMRVHWFWNWLEHMQWYALRGVVIGGFAVSVDYLDPISHTLNFSFAGNDMARKFFDDKGVNMAQFIYDFEIYCREGELKDRCQGDRNQDPRAALCDAMEGKSDDAIGQQSPRLRWDEWAEDFVKKRQCLLGWPAEVTGPSGPAPYSSIDRGRSGKILAEALLAPEGCEIWAETWKHEEITLADSLSVHCLKKNPEWLCIPIIVDQEGNALLTIGDKKAVNAGERGASHKTKRSSDEESDSDKSMTGEEEACKEEDQEAKRGRKIPRSKDLCEDSDVDEGIHHQLDATSTAAPAITMTTAQQADAACVHTRPKPCLVVVDSQPEQQTLDAAELLQDKHGSGLVGRGRDWAIGDATASGGAFVGYGTDIEGYPPEQLQPQYAPVKTRDFQGADQYGGAPQPGHYSHAELYDMLLPDFGMSRGATQYAPVSHTTGPPPWTAQPRLPSSAHVRPLSHAQVHPPSRAQVAGPPLVHSGFKAPSTYQHMLTVQGHNIQRPYTWGGSMEPLAPVASPMVEMRPTYCQFASGTTSTRGGYGVSEGGAYSLAGAPYAIQTPGQPQMQAHGYTHEGHVYLTLAPEGYYDTENRWETAMA
ncbi:hypothetical protein M422DRAFT_53511 [Sphaerobolus stellatus SS14]|uniref:Uncharacterized protein n=1 Tax=Sphaerobolus stellatus (strain SS14) TaxID=990650 RepID=A0A0C9TM93_SPHS4|nr:hypothetical protein M422DRAFT_53511 [Sphaerobolus stellatus SS14]